MSDEINDKLEDLGIEVDQRHDETDVTLLGPAGVKALKQKGDEPDEESPEE